MNRGRRFVPSCGWSTAASMTIRGSPRSSSRGAPCCSSATRAARWARQDVPSPGFLGVPLRANSILQARIRTAQYEDLEGRRRGGLLKGLMFVHLKKDLESIPVDWIDTQDSSILPRPDQLTSYGVDKGVQRRLAAIRTDSIPSRKPKPTRS